MNNSQTENLEFLMKGNDYRITGITKRRPIVRYDRIYRVVNNNCPTVF